MKLKIFLLFLILIMMCTTISSAFVDNYIWSVLDETVETSTQIGESVLDNNFLNLEAGSAILIEQNSGQILYGYNVHDRLHPASVTKIMSLLLIMEALESGKITLDTKIPCSENAESMGGSQIWLNTTETLTVNEMLKAIAVVSANDAVTAMAEYLGGTTDEFVKMMNEKAVELGMNDTHFVNCHGLDEDDHLTSAYDIALMSRELLTKYPSITNYTTIWTDTLRDGTSALTNTNKLVRNYSGCTGLKTGSTSQALFNVSASATRDGLSLIAVIMKAPTSSIRFANASSLLDYGFNNFSYTSFGTKGEVFSAVPITKGISDTVNAVFDDSPSFVIAKGQETNITYEITLAEQVQAPVSEGQQLGTISYYLDDEKLTSISLVAETSINKMNLTNMCKSVFNNWFSLLRNA